MDLPTYTSIWRIEKRLYKLYDFRLPMPLPIGQITVFAAISVPYVVLLTVLGLPFDHTLIWLYLLPPGVATWLVTRPVLESKRLPELIRSHVRYLAEPRVWCRMAPLAESDVIVVTGRVWRLPPAVMARVTSQASRPAPLMTAAAQPAPPGYGRPPAQPAMPPAQPAMPPAQPLRQPAQAGRGPASPGRRLRSPTAPPTRPASPAPAMAGPAALAPAAAAPSAVAPVVPAPAASAPAGSRPVVTVVNAGPAQQAPLAVEQALAGPAARRNESKADRVTVVPGGHRPGKPDQLQRDRARALLPIGGPRSVVVLGCTVGAGQTITTLLTGEILANLRPDSIAVLDLNPGADSLAQRAMLRPALGQAASLGPSRLAILAGRVAEGSITAPGSPGQDGETAGGQADRVVDPAGAVAVFEQARASHEIVLADPSTSAVPRLLAVTDQLVLVAPASAAAARAIGMTFEWLEAHGQAELAAAAIMVMNGVSRPSMRQVEQAERVCVGRCRAIVRVPWDDQLRNQQQKRAQPTAPGEPASQHSVSQHSVSQHSVSQHWAGLLSPATVSAYTALAGVLVASLTGQEAGHEGGQPGEQAPR